MSAYYYGAQHHQPPSSSSQPSAASSHNHNVARSRRAPRSSTSQNSHRQFRGVRSMKELAESPPVSAFRARFEAGRSFDLDDDLEFCPGLLTEDDLQSIHSSSSDGSVSSGSPQSSPMQHHVRPAIPAAPSFSLSPFAGNSYGSASNYQSNHHNQIKILQPSALRPRNAIPIVNPSTGKSLTSPPPSISPGMMQQRSYAHRW
jgi:hypothetical protein